MASWISHTVGFYSTLLDDVDLLKCQTTEKILGTWEWRISRTTIPSATMSKENTAGFSWFFHKLKITAKPRKPSNTFFFSRSLFVKAHAPTPHTEVHYRKFFDLNIRVFWIWCNKFNIHIYGFYGYPWPIGEPQQIPTWQGRQKHQGNLSHWTVVAPRKLTSFDWTGSYLWYA